MIAMSGGRAVTVGPREGRRRCSYHRRRLGFLASFVLTFSPPSQRASGAYPPGFERELDAVFARYAPPAASDDIELVTDQAEEAAGIDLAIPTASDKRGARRAPAGSRRCGRERLEYFSEGFVGEGGHESVYQPALNASTRSSRSR